jgi:hypothetical protein
MNHMISSTSSSDPVPALACRRWLITWAIAFAAALALTWTFLLLVDPYDSGRFSPLPQSRAFDSNARTANASRGRNSAFDSAIIGNSTAVALDPARLSESTGNKLRLAQLSVVASGPREQLTVLRWFMSHHKEIGAVVVVADRTWCTPDEPSPIEPFPFWLYGSDVDYLRHLMGWRSLELSFRRIRLALGLHAPARRLDGYWDFEGETTRAFPRPPLVARDAEDADTGAVQEAELGPQIFPYINQLTATAAELPADTTFVVVVPPIFAGALPPRHSLEALRLARCSAALAKAAATRSKGVFLDFVADNEMTRDPANFLDATHYREKIARHMEESIADAIAATVKRARSLLEGSKSRYL